MNNFKSNKGKHKSQRYFTWEYSITNLTNFPGILKTDPSVTK